MTALESSRVGAPERLSNLDVLRGMAAASVCLFHFSRHGFLADTPVQRIAANGYLGVDAFFVISGFVIPWALHRSAHRIAASGRFLAARMLRLYPAYAVAGIGSIVLWYASSWVPGFRGASPEVSLVALGANATLSCDFLHVPWLIPVYWTLAIEAQYYVAMALTFPLLTHRSAGIRGAVLALWIAAPLAFGAPSLLFAYTPLFAMGMVAFLQAARLLEARLAVIGAFAAFAAEWATAGIAPASVGLVSYALVAFAPACSLPPLVRLGTISYSLYLVHVPIGGRVVNLAERWCHGPWARLLVVVIAFAGSLLAAVALYRLVEKPSHELARRVSRSRARRETAPPLEVAAR